MKRESYAVVLIMMAFVSGMVLTAATSGCDASNRMASQTNSLSTNNLAE